MAPDLRPDIRTLREFWPFYVSQHLDRTCRRWHFAGTTNAILCTLGLLVTGRLWFIPLALVSSYGCAWIGHFVFEKNKPAAFQHPLWSLLCDFRMYAKMIAGTMGEELERARQAAGATSTSS